MCGRFAFYSPAEATARLFDASGSLDVRPRYNIAPTQDIAAIRPHEDGRELVALRWGLVPFWAKDPSIGNRMINARAETVAEKPAFRAAYRRRRCLVPADGFYEWKKERQGKTPWLISRKDGAPFAFAGLWERWTSKETGEDIESATLITTAANDFMAELHDRMPVILDPGSADRWLAGGDDALDYAIGHMPPLRAWPVDRRVNNARNEGEELIRPAGDAR
ncbi:MAG: SOS response-associated peptidase [Woeseiaceae bacterium]|nr:SOS response-associated peptidase [Woeseiaceae bacterium]